MHAYGKKNSVDEPVCRGAENDADVEKVLALYSAQAQAQASGRESRMFAAPPAFLVGRYMAPAAKAEPKKEERSSLFMLLKSMTE